MIVLLERNGIAETFDLSGEDYRLFRLRHDAWNARGDSEAGPPHEGFWFRRNATEVFIPFSGTKIEIQHGHPTQKEPE